MTGRDGVDAVNRTLVGLFGLLLTAAGVVGIIGATGLTTLDDLAAVHEAVVGVFTDPMRRWVLVVGLTVLAFLALWWALRQLVVRRPGDHLSNVVVDDTGHGRTSVEPAAVERAAAADLREVPHVTASSARLVREGPGYELRSRLDVEDGADLGAVRSAADEVVGRVGDLLGLDQLSSHTRLRPVPRARRVE